MSDEEEQPRPTGGPLEYWHSAERPISSVQMVFSFIAGLVLSAVGVFIVGGLCTGAVESNARNDKTGMYVVVAVWCAIFIGSIVATIRFSLSQRELSVEARRRPLRHFQLGALVGCGLAALMFGLCFTLM